MKSIVLKVIMCLSLLHVSAAFAEKDKGGTGGGAGNGCYGCSVVLTRLLDLGSLLEKEAVFYKVIDKVVFGKFNFCGLTYTGCNLVAKFNERKNELLIDSEKWDSATEEEKKEILERFLKRQ